ncbi:hypothetical protein IV64_GL001711 [Lactiplantibacillus xiangfangensis]|uniref:Uncharacterized protein n=1 Tax=Lactiplantibacillus xiangfangensis TaxID=942150 RepID=A0A0R2MRZ2_9LACO|nr:hypothetical protein [Lactiplantibacillus xiangfangensis]KRO14227.1 hypothetical protein IV64_GL001711 [Lactiplantibacillus xiangfangensis]
MKKKFKIRDLLSIEVHLDTDDEDEEMQWFPVFINTPNGVISQFSHPGDLDDALEFRMNEAK